MTRILSDKEFFLGDKTCLTGDELHYLIRVRRHREGDKIEIRCPSGRCMEAVVLRITSDEADIFIEQEKECGFEVLPIRILVSIPKRNLLDDVVRMTSELGIKSLCPVITERSVVKPDGNKVERWRRIAEESLRQCGRKNALIIEDITKLNSALQGAEGEKLILHPNENAVPIFEKVPFSAPLVFAIGPEGGFTKEEIQLAESSGFCTIRLLTPILRIETAAVAAASVAAAMLRSQCFKGY